MVVELSAIDGEQHVPVGEEGVTVTTAQTGHHQRSIFIGGQFHREQFGAGVGGIVG